jgi:hypothetical protein
MTVSSPEQTLVNNLITLKTQYEQALTEADTVSAHYREQLSHVNALLLNQIGSANGLAPFQTHIKSAEPILDAIAALQESTDINRLTLAPAKTIAEVSPTPTEIAPKPKQAKAQIKAQTSPAVGGRTPRELLPIHQGLKRLDAIAKVFQDHQGQEVTIDTLTEQLFGNLSTEAHKAERLKLRTLLYQGEQRGLWTKGDAASTYVIKTSGQATAKTVAQPKAKATKVAAKVAAKAADTRAQAKAPKAAPVLTTTKKRISLPLLSSFDGMTKLEAITSVLEKNRGEILHHDTIIQSLYGDLDLEELKAERVRIKTALLGGVKNEKWQKASVASSYFLPEASAGAKSKASGRKPKASKAAASESEPVTEAVAEVVPETTTDSSPKKGRRPAAAKTPVKSKFKRTRRTATQLNPEGA